MNILLIDFGASRVKSVLWSTKTNTPLGNSECPSSNPIISPSGEIVNDPFDYQKIMDEHLNYYASSKIDRIYLCTEMHGVLATTSENVPLTYYMGWRNEEGFIPDSLISKRVGFEKETGLRLMAGLPCCTLSSLKWKHDALPTNIKLHNLATWLCSSYDPSAEFKTSRSLAESTGLFSMTTNSWSDWLFSLAGLSLTETEVPRIAEPNEVIGHIRGIPVYGGIGDLQAAVLGIGFPQSTDIVINLGTGSQIVAKSDLEVYGLLERRSLIDGITFDTLTHIPSGRALNVFASFVDSIAQTPTFWPIFKSLTVGEVLNSDNTVDLNVFKSAYHYSDGGSISRINENKFHLRGFIASVACSWLIQYYNMLLVWSANYREKVTFSLSGGLSHIPFVAPVLQKLLRMEYTPFTPITGEETLDGLLYLAKRSINANV